MAHFIAVDDTMKHLYTDITHPRNNIDYYTQTHTQTIQCNTTVTPPPRTYTGALLSQCLPVCRQPVQLLYADEEATRVQVYSECDSNSTATADDSGRDSVFIHSLYIIDRCCDVEATLTPCCHGTIYLI